MHRVSYTRWTPCGCRCGRSPESSLSILWFSTRRTTCRRLIGENPTASHWRLSSRTPNRFLAICCESPRHFITNKQMHSNDIRYRNSSSNTVVNFKKCLVFFIIYSLVVLICSRSWLQLLLFTLLFTSLCIHQR